MKVKSILPALAAGAVVVVAVALPVNTAFAADKPQQPSAKLAKPLHDAQEDLKAKKWTDAITKIKEADATAGKTAYDQHVINDFFANAYINTQSYGDAAKYIELELDDGFTTEQEKPQKLRALAELNYQVKNYDKVIEFGNRSLKNQDEERMRTLVGQAYYLKGDFKGAQNSKTTPSLRKSRPVRRPRKTSCCSITAPVRKTRTTPARPMQWSAW
jgi:hypothetical protein